MLRKKRIRSHGRSSTTKLGLTELKRHVERTLRQCTGTNVTNTPKGLKRRKRRVAYEPPLRKKLLKVVRRVFA